MFMKWQRSWSLKAVDRDRDRDKDSFSPKHIWTESDNVKCFIEIKNF